MTFTSGLGTKVIMSQAYLRISRDWMHIGVFDCSVLFWGHCDLAL